MSTDQQAEKCSWYRFFAALLLVFLSVISSLAGDINTLSAYTSYPPSLTAKRPPNVIVALDVSGSMKQSAYTQADIAWKSGLQTDFSPTVNYFGYFDRNSRYSYATDKQFFYAEPGGEWDGNFLNWATMRRIDIARKVVVGGKVSVRTLDQDAGSPTAGQRVAINRNKAKKFSNWQADWDRWYVLEGQNEPFDYQFYKQVATNATDRLTPASIVDGTSFLIRDQRIIPQHPSGGTAIPLSEQAEVGQLTIDLHPGDEWHWVPFVNRYHQPRVVVKAQTFNGGNALSDPRIRMRNGWDGLDNNGFFVRLQEWDYLDGKHTVETFAYLVVEAGTAGGAALGCIDISDDQGGVWQFCAEADSPPVDSNNCGVPNSTTGGVPQQIDWDAPLPRAKPIVFSGLTTWNEVGDSDALNVRNYFPAGPSARSSLLVTIQEQESFGGNSRCRHDSAEQVAAIAVVPPRGTRGISSATWTYAEQTIRIKAGVLRDLTQDWLTLSYDTKQPFRETPLFIADLQSFNEVDPVTIRVSGSSAANNRHQIKLKLQEETSADHETSHAGEDVGWLAVEFNPGYAIRVGVKQEPIGLVQKAAGSMRLGLAVYNYDHDLPPAEIYTQNRVHGGTLYPCYPDTGLPVDQRTTTDICLPTGVQDPLGNIIQVVEEHPLIWGTTPIAETLVEIGNYLQQNSSNGNGFYDDKSPLPTYPHGVVDGVDQDPYHYQDLALGQDGKLDCAQTFVLHINDGEPYNDWDGSGHPSIVGDGIGRTGNNEMLDDVAFSLRQNDLRTDPELPGHQEVISYYVLAALGDTDAAQYSRATRRLREAAINGGFVADKNSLNENHAPDPPHPADVNRYILANIDPATGLPDCRDKRNEWDRDGDCNPDNFYFANDGFALEKQLAAAFLSIGKRTSSGSAASVVSNTRSGSGAIYQSLYFPEYDDNQGNVVEWAGQLHALLVDDYGNIREDTQRNGRLDVADDLFIRFYTDANEGLMVRKYRDGIQLADGTLLPADGRLDASELAKPVATGKLEDVSFLWNSSAWLNAAGLTASRQRSYRSSDQERYIFTYIDDGDKVPEAGEVIDFATSNRARIAPYLHVAEPFSFTEANPPAGVRSADFEQFFTRQTERVINWVRGEDQGVSSFGRSSLAAMRSRHYRYRNDQGLEDSTWRLGDIVSSTPTVVGRPAENFDLLYRDSSYSAFYTKYKHRRNVVYVGANDGMFHAFNAGFYHAANKAWLQQPILSNGRVDSSKTNFELGAELWAYVPQNLLPHLYWLTRPDYTHVYYNDLKPKVFDARIFPKDAGHPGGWGTLLVGGMRLGGGAINADLNHNGVLDETDPLLTSAFFIFDITDPEVPPRLLAEISMPGLGFTTSYPTVVSLYDSSADTSNNYLLFGSGPADPAGLPDSLALAEVASRQAGKIFLLNLNKLVDGSDRVCFMAAEGTCVDAEDGPPPLVTLDENSFISQPISVDWDLDYSADAVYFGTVSGNKQRGWGGKFRRIVIDDDNAISSWDSDSLFLDLSVGKIIKGSDGRTVASGQPITAAPSAGLQKRGDVIERWLYFGTGRYLTGDDIENSDQQSYYGLKEPKDAGFSWTYLAVERGEGLLDVSQVRVYDGGGDVKNSSGVSSFETLSAKIDLEKQGWLLNFADYKERNLGQAALLGNVLTFTSYLPNQTPCGTAGESWLYALDYRTGTAGSKPILGTLVRDKTGSNDNVAEKERNKKRVKAGSGVSSSPGLHTGRQQGSKVFLQSSSGAITAIEQTTSGPTKSGVLAWEVE